MTLPSLSNSPTKERIIELLSNNWPLTAKKIYMSLAKEHNLSITYQAVHKSLQELIQNNILEKTKEGYSINKNWVENLGNFSQKVKSRLENIGEIETKTMQKFNFKTHDEFLKFHFELIEKIVKEEGKLNMVFLTRHVPFPNAITRKEIELLEKIKSKVKWKIISKTWTPLDQLFADFWRKLGVEVENNPNISNVFTIINNDYILDVYKIPHIEALKEWDAAYEKSDVSKIDFAKMHEQFANKGFKYMVTLIKDKELSKILRS